VRRLLELARADVAGGGDERADLAAVLAASAERHRRLGIDLRLELGPRLGRVTMGEEALDTILSNLLAPSGGRAPGRGADGSPSFVGALPHLDHLLEGGSVLPRDVGRAHEPTEREVNVVRPRIGVPSRG